MRPLYLRLLVLLMALAVPAGLAAQDQPTGVRDLAAALAAERARIAELQAELERRAAVLADLATRLEQIVPSLETPEQPPASSPPVQEQPPAPLTVESPIRPEPVRPGFELYGDAKIRYETLKQDFPGCVGCPDRLRGRLRLRFGAAGNLSPDFTAVMGFGVGEVNDPNTVYVNLGNNFSRKVATWDRVYVEYHPTQARWMKLTAGKFPYTWMRSSMTFDVDFYPEGLSERVSFDLPRAGRLKNVGVQGFQLLVNEQPGDQRMTIVGTQLTAKAQTTDRVSTLVAVTGVDIRRPEFMTRALLDGSDVGVRNTNATVLNNGMASPASGFRYANVIVENVIRTPFEALPVTVGVEYQHNLRAASDRSTATSLRVDAGRAQRQGDWNFGFHIFRVEQDAILAGLGESDWRAPSNVLQQRWAVDRMVNSNVQLSFTLYRGRTLDRTLPGALTAPNLPLGLRDPWTNRVYLDVTYRY